MLKREMKLAKFNPTSARSPLRQMSLEQSLRLRYMPALDQIAKYFLITP